MLRATNAIAAFLPLLQERSGRDWSTPIKGALLNGDGKGFILVRDAFLVIMLQLTMMRECQEVYQSTCIPDECPDNEPEREVSSGRL